MLVILLIVYLLYAGILFVLAAGFRRMQLSEAGEEVAVPVSIIICARNEEKYLAGCLRGIVSQEYPKNMVQIIVVNDASTDKTVLIADLELEHAGIEYRILSNPVQRGKKNCITTAIKFARHELIVLRDADTYTPSDKWLRTVTAKHHSTGGVLIGPVLVDPGSSVIGALQSYENAILALAAGGSAYFKKPFLCSGANMAFRKEHFNRVGGYSSHVHLVSGDDVFFLEDVKKLGDVPIHFLKSRQAVVQTYPVEKPAQLLLQRARWASKFRFNTNSLNLALAISVFAANTAFIFSLAAMVLKPAIIPELSLYIFLKTATDFFLLFLASSFVRPLPKTQYLLPVMLMYPFYATAVSCLSLFTSPAWKTK